MLQSARVPISSRIGKLDFCFQYAADTPCRDVKHIPYCGSAYDLCEGLSRASIGNASAGETRIEHLRLDISVVGQFAFVGRPILAAAAF
jgi:hypothetical protein